MPATGWAVRMLWQDGPLAISETYIWNGAADNPVTVVYPNAVRLMKARTAMMGASVVAVSFRLSKIGSFREYINSNPADIATMSVGPLLVATSLTAAQAAAGISNQQEGTADQAPAAILANIISTPASHFRKFLSGVPDVLIRENPAGPWTVGVPGWLSLFNAWASVLTNATLKWCFKGRTLPTVAPWAPVAVSAYLFDAVSGFWQAQAPTLAAPIAVGSKVQLRGFKMNSRAYVPANGTFQVAAITPGAIGGQSYYTLRGSQNVAGTQINVLGTIQGVDFTSFPIVQVTPGGETTHKRGNRSLAAPGRRRVLQRVSG